MRVLLTGALGNLGRVVSAELLERGYTVLAADVETPTNRRLASAESGHRALVRLWCDLTNSAASEELVRSTRPDAVIHLAALIPPGAYDRPELARRINVDATATLVRHLEKHAPKARFIFASSMAVYGPRNPHTTTPPVTSRTKPAPPEIYGAHKIECEQLLADSSLETTILRIGAVVSPRQMFAVDLAMIYLEACLPIDGRVHLVDVRDVARAFASAVVADCAGKTLLIGGDASHQVTQGELAEAMTKAIGFPGVLPVGRPGNPSDDQAWFSVEWMDTSEAQALLDFQHTPLSQTLADARAAFGALRLFGPIGAPIGRRVLARRSPLRESPGTYSDPWQLIEKRWGPKVLTR